MNRTIFASAMLIAGAILTIGNAEDLGLAMMGVAFIVALASPAKRFFVWLYAGDKESKDPTPQDEKDNSKEN